MNRNALFSLSLAVVMGLAAAGIAVAATTPATDTPAPATQPAVDLHNTKCPVSGDDVGDSKLTATYEGKIYHFCCADCPGTFAKDPAKYAKAVAANPAKYGVKTGG